MAFTVEWTVSAEKRLDEIYWFYRRITDKSLATNITRNIILNSLELEYFPERCQKEILLNEYEGDYRYKVFSNFKIIFKIIKNTVYVVDVFDCRRDPAFLKTNFRIE